MTSALVQQDQAESTTPLLLEVAEENAERIPARAGFELRGELHQFSCWLPIAADEPEGGDA